MLTQNISFIIHQLTSQNSIIHQLNNSKYSSKSEIQAWALYITLQRSQKRKNYQKSS